jgi:magnesium transporter
VIDLDDLVHRKDFAALRAWIETTSEHEIADELARLDRDDRAVVFRLLDRDVALEVFEELDPPIQQQVLEGLRDDRFRQLVEDMDPDDRAELVGELPAKIAKRVLAGLSEAERSKTAELLGYPEESAGRLMTPEFVSLRASMSVAQALEKVRRLGADAETVYTLPVTDDERRLVGVVSLRQLVLGADDDTVEQLMNPRVLAVHVSDDQEVAARLVQEADLLALPVLDSEHRLVGVITVDDAMEVLEAEETEDQALAGATQPLGQPYLSVSLFQLARSRALWLLVLVAAAALTVNVLQVFQGTLEQAVSLALFVPLLIDTGGNSGAQAATVITRAMAVGDVRFTDLPVVIWREARVGIMLGSMLAVAGFVPIALIFDSDLATVVSLSVVTICTLATFAGATLPMLAKRAGVDPAVVSAPLITTLVDATGLVVYFLIARAVLGL